MLPACLPGCHPVLAMQTFCRHDQLTKIGVLQQAERVNASRLVMIAPDEWAKGLVRVKDLAARTEQDVPQDKL